jgi:hypothetical protein
MATDNTGRYLDCPCGDYAASQRNCPFAQCPKCNSALVELPGWRAPKQTYQEANGAVPKGPAIDANGLACQTSGPESGLACQTSALE